MDQGNSNSVAFCQKWIHLNHIFEKLNVETRTAAAMLALETLGRARLPARQTPEG